MSENTSTALVSISRAKQALAEAREFTEIVEIRDRAVAAKSYAAARGADDVARMAEIKLRAERKAGEFLSDMKKEGKLITHKRPKGSQAASLTELGIEKDESSRWQRISSIPEEHFEEYIATSGELTQAALLRAANKLRNQAPAPVETPPFPAKRFRCIVVDPPWPMEKIVRTVRPNQGVMLDYPTMTLEEIEGELPIKKLANPEGCHVYLWMTQRFRPAAYNLFEAWGVKYHCEFAWVKPTGMTPYSFMFNIEPVLFGRIGHLDLLKFGVKLNINAPSMKHSRKPDIFYEIVRTVSPGPRLNMFARESREGFESWGVK